MQSGCHDPGNRRIKQRDIDLKIGISQEGVHNTNEMLNYRKVWARWVPRQLTGPMKDTPSLQPRFGTVRLLVVPKIEGDVTKSTFFTGCRS